MLTRLLVIAVYSLTLASCLEQKTTESEWPVYGGSHLNNRYSPLDQINVSNIANLQPAWIFETGDADTANHSQIQCNPLIINGTLYGTTPAMKLFAIDAATGKEQWTFNPYDSLRGDRRSFFIMNNCRGLSYWTDGKADRRLFYSAGSELLCVDADSGKLVSSFGSNGRIDLHEGLGRDVANLYISATSPGAVYKDLLILGSRVDEDAAAAPGHIRAFNVRTGKLEWVFHTIPEPGEAGHESWEDPEAWKRIGGANNWSGMSLDEKRGIVFVPTGSASFDFYGGRRKGDNLYANCLLALDAETGKRKWHFQSVHHDVWDRDFPTPPALVTVKHNGKMIDAVAQPGKTGFIFVLNRETGEPLFPVSEQVVPINSELKGEKLSPTQPIPALPKPLVRQSMTESDLNNLVTDSSFQDIRSRLASYRKDHMYAPPSKQGTLIFPGFDGGAEWGGPAFDPESGVLYVNANEMPWVLTIVDKPRSAPNEDFAQAGQRLYRQYCMACHGPDRKGSGNYPSLETVTEKYNSTSLAALMKTGRRMMPGFAHLKPVESEAIVATLMNQKETLKKPFPVLEIDSFLNLPYGTTGYNKFLTKEGYPAVKPPWGTLSAVNLHTGERSWQVMLGDHPDFAPRGIQTGTENYGGPVVTAGGLIFIAATPDGKIRAFDKANGKVLWQYQLPAAGFATPAVYSVGGRQFVVIACGGGKLGTKSGGSYVAFALPATNR